MEHSDVMVQNKNPSKSCTHQFSIAYSCRIVIAFFTTIAMNPDIGIVQAENNPSLLPSYNILSLTGCGKMSTHFNALGQSQIDTHRLSYC